MEDPHDETEEVVKTGREISLWWPRLTGVVLAFLTLLLFGGIPLPLPYEILGESAQFVFQYGTWAAVLLVIAAAFLLKGMNSVIAVRWWAKIVGTITIVSLATVIIGESIGGQAPPVKSITDVLPLLPYLFIAVGMAVSFRWELVGGILVAAGGITEQSFVSLSGLGSLNPFIVIFVPVGLGLIYCWWRLRRLRGQTAQIV